MVRSRQSNDWSKSEAHLLLLSKFLDARTAEETAWAASWRDALRETSQQAINRFVEEGLLVPAGLSSQLAYLTHKYKVIKLQAMLKERGLPVFGRKDALISRLVEADPEGMKKAVAGLTLLQCSDRGQEIANQYLASEKEKREATEQAVLAMLQKGNLRDACSVVYAYRAKQVFSHQMWKSLDPSDDVVLLESILGSKPALLTRLPESKSAPLRVATGMMYLWREGTDRVESWLPCGFETGLAMDNGKAAAWLLSYCQYQAELAE